MKQIPLLLLLLAAALHSFAQKTTLSGVVTDSSGAVLPAASVILMEQRDSVIAAFGQTESNGAFTIRRVLPGDYLLQISYAGMETHYQTVSTSPDRPTIDLGKMALYPAIQALRGVDVTAQRTPVRFRNDTIEYNAGAFQTQPGSVVEDLLRKLPGVDVQSDGTIRAQGEIVRNVMVDGKEFFGQDPKIATKNLPADVVNKVQVYDKKSERAEFTGIEDGREEKTINIQLKDGAKKGFFGNISAGYGTKDRYESKFNVNRFSGKTQISAIGAANNVNQQAFSFDDYINLMGGISSLMSGSGGTSGRVRISLDDNSIGLPMGGALNSGFTDTWAGGLNLNHEFSKKAKLSANYFYNRLQNDLDRTIDRVNLLDKLSFNSFETEQRQSKNDNHRLNLTFKSSIDSSQNITLRSRWSLNNAYFGQLSSSETFNTAGFTQNTGTRDYQSNGNTWRGDGVFTYRKRLAKKGRALVADASFQQGNDDRSGYIWATNTYWSDSTSLSESIRQRQQYDDNPSNWGTSVAYTEPLGQKQYLEWNAAHRQYNNETGKSFYDQIATPTPGEVFNPLLSSRFRRGYRYEQAGMNYMRNRKKYEFTAGLALQQSVLDGSQPETNFPGIRRTFTRILPAAFYHYEPKIGSNLSVEYSTSLREPALEQLLPVVDNSDPLNVYTGNPNLKPEYVHDLGVNWMRFDAFSNTLFFASINSTYTQDRITNAGTIDSLFRRNLTPINVESDVLVNTYLNFSRPIRPIKCTVNLTLNSTWNRGILFINEVRNNTDRWVNYLEASLDNRRKKVVDFTVGARFTQNSTAYSVSKNLNQTFINQRYFGDVTVFPNHHWALSTGMDYQVYSAESFGGAQEIPIWKASITRYVLKNRKGQIKLSAFDLLNRNVGISRNSQFNYLEEVRSRNLSRYFMLTFAYSMSGFGAKDNGIEIIRGK